MDNEVSLQRGIVWGLVATAAMTLVMLIGMVTGIAPMPEPIPVALAGLVLTGAPKPALLVSGMLAHFVYGAAAGVLFVRWSPRVDLLGAILFGVVLWLVMQVVFLPVLGWGVFGAAVTGRIAVATLVLHLIYGAVLGLVGRGTTGPAGAPAGAEAPDSAP